MSDSGEAISKRRGAQSCNVAVQGLRSSSPQIGDKGTLWRQGLRLRFIFCLGAMMALIATGMSTVGAAAEQSELQ